MSLQLINFKYMSTQTTIQIRIDSKIKREAKKILEEIGLDLSSGLKLFLHNVAITQSIPIELRTVNGFTREHEARMIEGVREAEASGKRYSDIHQMLKEI